MIRITATGSDTFNIKDVLRDNHFRWIPESKSWQRTIPDSGIDALIEKIRCPLVVGKDVTLMLESVDVTGKKIYPKVLFIKLKEVVSGSYFKIFMEEVCGIKVHGVDDHE